MRELEFTYCFYAELLNSLKQQGYVFADYHNHDKYNKTVILRHDIDNSIIKAVKMAELESRLGVNSTYFLLLTSDFYNPASKKSIEGIKAIQNLGHEIGLHFDEVAYEHIVDVPAAIIKEAQILSEIIGSSVTTVSMHRPSPKTLTADYKIPGMVNSYSSEFFKGYKYLSDSRRRWREPVMDVIGSGMYDKLHILTHAIWYNDEDESIHDTIKKFVTSANIERYHQEKDNIQDLESILCVDEI